MRLSLSSGIGDTRKKSAQKVVIGSQVCYISHIANITDIEAIPATLRAIRANLDFTQEQLADRLGVSFATVNRWEGGNAKPQKAAREAIEALALEAGIEDAELEEMLAEAAARVTRRRSRRQSRSNGATDPSSTKGMEQMLWDAACSIRGEKDAAKFKDFLLPLLFLKRLSDVFEDEIQRLAEKYGDESTAWEIAEGDHDLLRFWLPAEARWNAINGREPCDWPLDTRGRSTAPKDIGEHLTTAVRAVVKHNPSLSGVLDIVDFAAERNGERDINPTKLVTVVEILSDPRYRLGLADVQPDFLGRAYEYLLRKFAEGSGQSAGEFFTPTEVGFLMAHIMRPRPGDKCHDYACGSAGLLVKLQLVARELDPTSQIPLRLTGQELQAESYAVAHMNAIIHDMEIEIARGDTMINPKFKTPSGQIGTNDIVVANPMWNQPFDPDIFTDDPFDRFRPQGGATTGKGDWAWLQHTLACLNDSGRAAVVLDTGAMTRGSGSQNEDKERNIRKWFVDNDLIDGVILLPDNLFYNTSAAGVIVVLSKRKAESRQGKIVLLNASGQVKKGRPKNFIPEEGIRPLAKAYLKGEPVEGEVAVITKEQVEQADYNLSPGRWVMSLSAEPSVNLSDVINKFELILKEEATILELVKNSIERMKEFDSLSKEFREDQKETKIGSIPKRWKIRQMGELFEISSGKTMTPVAREGINKVPFLRTSNVFWDRIDLSSVDEISIPEHELSSKLLKPGDLLVCEGGEIGRAAVWNGEVDIMSFQNHIHRLRPLSENILPRFYVYFLQAAFTQLGIFDGIGNRTTIPNLSRNQLANLYVPQPPIDEQERIVETFSGFQDFIVLQTNKSIILNDFVKNLLRILMTGEILFDRKSSEKRSEQ